MNRGGREGKRERARETEKKDEEMKKMRGGWHGGDLNEQLGDRGDSPWSFGSSQRELPP